MTPLVGKEALIPNPALSSFERLIGEWKTAGRHPLVPGATFHGRTSIAWHEGGAFLIIRSEIDEPEIPSGMAVIGSDDAAATYFMLYFDERGVSRKYDVTMTGNVLTWWREAPGFSQRATITVEEGGAEMIGKGEMKRDDGPWEDDLSLTYVKVHL